MRTKSYIFLFILVIVLVSCDKGYEVRFSNFYIEPMDSVYLPGTSIVFKNVETEQNTGYQKISKGKHAILLVSKNKTRMQSQIDVPSTGTGKLTIQVDGIKQISILEE
jgi:hypothetical protein